ncbi:Amidohydrolase family protein [Paenibacillus tianmuensis]|uniref:Amidohydrolase family protein n=1 Tax=Paenibacillus tianmuensis TaxID=624147 RepID=A0A1G4RFI9_9BACL|nr:amidohydrolase family protein [Paenibacillus tianmuensis]SCW55692.1 Amidohydrolase family protein [Paenibacillus tianmuensis]
MLDLIIRNGHIADGTGNPWFFGDVGVKDGRIAAVGRVEQEARSVIDAHRQVIAPGFIDGHCHSDLMIFDHPHSEIKIRQGVTTEVVGNCGLAPAPFVKERAELL